MIQFIPKVVLISQVVRLVWGLAHSLPSKQGGTQFEGNVEHRQSLAKGDNQIAEHSISGDLKKHPNRKHSCRCDDSRI